MIASVALAAFDLSVWALLLSLLVLLGMAIAKVVGIVERIAAFDRALVEKGFPPMAPWWIATLTAFYLSGCRQLVLRVGRRGGKSTSLVRVACLEALYGEHVIPPGDIGIVAIISVNRDEAAKRLRLIEAILKALGIPYRPLKDGLGWELVNRPIAFQIFTASIAGVSGGTVICAICDEVAKWKDADTGANPAREVLASLRPALATQKNAKIFLSSSPMGTDDAHATAFEQGDNAFQRCAWAPSWVANPSLTEDDCRALEPDEKLFDREYRAVPQNTLTMAFDADAVAAMFGRSWAQLCGYDYPPIVVMDPSNNAGNDALTSAVAHWQWPNLEGVVEVRRHVKDSAGNPIPHTFYVSGDDYEIEPGKEWMLRPVLCLTRLEVHESHVAADEIAADIAVKARVAGASLVVSDQRESYTWKSLIQRYRGLRFEECTWTNQAKHDAVLWLRRSMKDRQVCVPTNDTSATMVEQLKAELGNFTERITPAGNFQYAARGSGHDDLVALLVTAAIADATGFLRGSPVGAVTQGHRRTGNESDPKTIAGQGL